MVDHCERLICQHPFHVVLSEHWVACLWVEHARAEQIAPHEFLPFSGRHVTLDHVIHVRPLTSRHGTNLDSHVPLSDCILLCFSVACLLDLVFDGHVGHSFGCWLDQKVVRVTPPVH